MAVVLIVLLVITLISDHYGEPPTYLTGALGTAVGALFAALGSDKGKREADVRDTAQAAQVTADRADAKADKLADVAAHEHPEVAPVVKDEPPFNPPTPPSGATP